MELLPPTKTFCVSEHTETMPDDIILNILMKLPVKSLLKFRCVSKNWNSIIKSQTFKLNYTISKPLEYIFVHSLQDPSIPSQFYTIFRENSFSKISKLEIPSNFDDIPNNPVRWIVEGSCNGLLCISKTGDDLYLWNPSIRKHKILTTPTITTLRGKCVTNSIFNAFGFDSKNDDFKILRIVCPFSPRRNSKKPQAEIYSLGTDSWRLLELMEGLERLQSHDYTYTNRLNSRDYAYVDGAFHWLAQFTNKQGTCYSSILRFEIEKERFREVKLPNDYMKVNNLCNMKLVVLKGFLGLIVNGNNKPYDWGNMYGIWMMNKEGLWKMMNKRFDRSRWFCGCVGDQLVLEEKNSTRVFLFDPHTFQETALDVLRPDSVHAFSESLALL